MENKIHKSWRHKYLAALLFVGFISTSAMADSLNVTKGMTLKYKITRSPDTMTLKVIIKELSPQVIFDFILRSRNSFYGRVIMTPQALMSGTRQYNYSVKGDVTLADATAVWVSQLEYTKWKDSVALMIAPDGKQKIFQRVKYLDFEVLKDGKKIVLPSFLVESSDSPKDSFVIADNKNFPIIMRMNLGFDFELTEIISEEKPIH